MEYKKSDSLKLKSQDNNFIYFFYFFGYFYYIKKLILKKIIYIFNIIMSFLKQSSVFENASSFPVNEASMVPVDGASIVPVEPNESFFGFSSNNSFNATFA